MLSSALRGTVTGWLAGRGDPAYWLAGLLACWLAEHVAQCRQKERARGCGLGGLAWCAGLVVGGLW